MRRKRRIGADDYFLDHHNAKPHWAYNAPDRADLRYMWPAVRSDQTTCAFYGYNPFIMHHIGGEESVSGHWFTKVQQEFIKNSMDFYRILSYWERVNTHGTDLLQTFSAENPHLNPQVKSATNCVYFAANFLQCLPNVLWKAPVTCGHFSQKQNFCTTLYITYNLTASKHKKDKKIIKNNLLAFSWGKQPPTCWQA